MCLVHISPRAALNTGAETEADCPLLLSRTYIRIQRARGFRRDDDNDDDRSRVLGVGRWIDR